MTEKDSQNFVYDKKVYTHGFEEIYALEKIDVKSIRKVVTTAQVLTEKSEGPIKQKKHEEIKVPQLRFGFTEQDEWIDSFKLQEPIFVLQLSSQAEKRLLEMGVRTLNDLQNFSLFKGIGQGHVDEIQEKIKNYIGEDEPRVTQIDFLSLLKCVLGDLESKHTHLLLAPYHLADFFPITPGERMNVRHLNGAKREEALAKAFFEARKEERKLFIHNAFQKIFLAFIQPWLQRRGGLAKKEDIMERLLKKSFDPKISSSALRLIINVYFDAKFPFDHVLIPIEASLYALNEDIKKRYIQITSKAKSYFYRHDVTYLFDEFLLFLAKDWTSNWEQFAHEFVIKTLCYSPSFRVRKGLGGNLHIALNFLDDIIIKTS